MSRKEADTSVRPLLLLEINEVPWRLIDEFVAHPELPSLRAFFGAARTRTTRSTDIGELHPWVTWPSFHRGMDNRSHGIAFLGQDPATFKGKPIWQEYRERGHSVGIFGSLQSWPPQDPGPGGFHVPDTFARDERCIPEWVEPFQRFNLRQTGSNGRVINEGSLYRSDSLGLLLSLPRLGIRAATCAAVARQLVSERLDRTQLARRPIFQGILAWDVFRKLFDPGKPPAFSTFFTNHVAGIMHRYWDHVFPADLGKDPNARHPHRETMLFALKVLDRMLGEALELQAANPELILAFASSMGQGPVNREHHEGREMSIPRVRDLLVACGLGPADFEPLLAMVPQICVQIPDARKRQATRELLERATLASGEMFISIEEISDRLSITTVTPRSADIDAGRFRLGGRDLTWDQAGIQFHAVEKGSGYHIPEGTLAVTGRGIGADPARAPMLATEAKDFLLTLAGVR